MSPTSEEVSPEACARKESLDAPGTCNVSLLVPCSASGAFVVPSQLSNRQVERITHENEAKSVQNQIRRDGFIVVAVVMCRTNADAPVMCARRLNTYRHWHGRTQKNDPPGGLLYSIHNSRRER